MAHIIRLIRYSYIDKVSRLCTLGYFGRVLGLGGRITNEEEMNEKLIEKKLSDGVRRAGGMALKFGTSYHRGMPDRIVLLPDGKVQFVELKTTGQKPTALQIQAMARLRELGFTVEVIDTQDGLNKFFESL